MFNTNIEVQIGIGTIVETFDGNKRYTTSPMQLISMDGIQVAFKRVDVDNFSGNITFNRAFPITEIYHDQTSELVDFKPTSQQEFFKEIDKFVSKRFQNKRKEFVKNTVPEYSENQMLQAIDRCLFIFDNERYQKESKQYNQEMKEFFDSLFEN